MGARAIDPDRDVGAARSARDSTEHATRGSLPVPGSEGAPPGLPPRYLACLRILEALPENRSGADKTWVEEALRSFRDHYRQARRVR
jgi:hypothetical protein